MNTNDVFIIFLAFSSPNISVRAPSKNGSIPVQLFKTSGKAKTQIARDLGISDSALNKWCKEFEEQGKEAFPGKGHQTSLEEEMKRLKRENDILRQERDILKKLI